MFAWYLCNVCVVFAWFLRDVCVVFVWCLCGVYMAFVWCSCGVCLVFVWSVRFVWCCSLPLQPQASIITALMYSVTEVITVIIIVRGCGTPIVNSNCGVVRFVWCFCDVCVMFV